MCQKQNEQFTRILAVLSQEKNPELRSKAEKLFKLFEQPHIIPEHKDQLLSIFKTTKVKKNFIFSNYYLAIN